MTKPTFDISTLKVTKDSDFIKPSNEPDPVLDCGTCSECGWTGKLSDCIKEEEGNYDTGYYWAVYCPVCEDGGCIENFYPSAESLAEWKREHEHGNQ